MHTAYIILAHKFPDLLIRLVDRLQSDDATFLIHVDRKTRLGVLAQMRQGMRHFSNAYFIERNDCHWGDFGVVRATLTAMNELLSRDIPFDYAILLTGQDYPIKPRHEIESRLAGGESKSFIGYMPLPCENWDIMGRIERWHYQIFSTRVGLPLSPKGERFKTFAPVKSMINRLLPRKRSFFPDIKPYAGSAYWNLSREAVRHVSDYVNHNPDFVRFFRRALLPDELFFQTILLNSSFEDRIINDNLRYIDFSDTSGGANHPAIFDERDFERLSSSSALFARKFDPSVDSRILDLIDERLLGA